MNPNTMKQVLEYLDKLGEKIGVGAQAIWPWFIRQVYVDAILSWVLFLVLLVTNIFLWRYAMAHWNPRKEDDDGYRRRLDNIYNIRYEDHEGIWVFFLSISTVLLVIAIVCFLNVGFDWLNPEYHAFKSLVKLLNPIVQK